MKIASRFISSKTGKYLEEVGGTAVFETGMCRENRIINIYPDRTYQEILGFGAAFTETSAYNYAQMSEQNKTKIIEAYFSKEKGLCFNFCRTHIHSCDFSLSRYIYTEENDEKLETFSIERDRKYILPFLKAAIGAADDMLLFASPWTPPAWMKDNHDLCHGGRLLDAYYQNWADYMVRYVQEYQKEGISLFGMTVQNEPAANQTWESCMYKGSEEGVFAHGYLRPALDKAGFQNIRIMIWDHNRERVYDRARDSFAVPGAKEDIWGITYHWYSGDHYACLDMAHDAFPDKPLILSESSLGAQRGETTPGAHSSWTGLELWAEELIENFNHYMVASVAWNMVVDEDGGPFHDREKGCKAPIVVDTKQDTLSIEPLYYAIAHFSRFIQRGAIRLGTSTFGEMVKVAAFRNPNGEICVVLLNKSEEYQTIYLRIEGQCISMELEGKTLTTCMIREI